MSSYEAIAWCKVSYYCGKAQTAFFMQRRKGWLEYADKAIEFVPKLLPGLFQVPEAQTMAPLIYIDWLTRSSLAHEIFSKRQSGREIVFADEEEGDAGKDKEAKLALLHKRLASIRDCITELSKLALACAGNYQHKVHIEHQVIKSNIHAGVSSAG